MSSRGRLPQTGAVAAPVFRQVDKVLRVSRERLALSRGHLRGGRFNGIHPGFEVIQRLIGGLTPCRRGHEQSEKTTGGPKLPTLVEIDMAPSFFHWLFRVECPEYTIHRFARRPFLSLITRASA
jgi:hypothetical protein